MENLQRLKDEKHELILRSMIEYMNFEDDEDDCDFLCGYTQAEIDECGNILDHYIDSLSASNGTTDEIMISVKNAIDSLNKLNEKANCELIETDQREALCSFIEIAAVEAGLPQPSDDITEEWREW